MLAAVGVLLATLSPAEEPSIRLVNEGTTRWKCVEVIDGKDVEISPHTTQSGAESCAVTQELRHPEREFRTVGAERIQPVIVLAQAAPMPPMIISPTSTEPTDPSPTSSRNGLINEILFDDTSFEFGTGASRNNFAIPHNAIDNKRIQSTGGSYGAWDSTRIVDLQKALGIRGPESNFAYRMRLVYGRDYESWTTYPRTGIYITNGGGYNDRLKDDREYWYCKNLIVPSNYVVDTAGGSRETIEQYKNADNGRGHMVLYVGDGKWQLLTETTASSTDGGPEVIEWSQDIDSDIGKGENIWVEHIRWNPFSTKTTVTSGMGKYAQVGETFEGNRGILEVWKSLAPGASGKSATLGTVTNNSGERKMMKIVERVNEPVGLVPSWKDGDKTRGSWSIAPNLNKPGWYQDQSPPPSCPHSKTTKCGEIEMYWQSIRLLNASGSYSACHPTMEARP